jgi:hypothetical protein
MKKEPACDYMHEHRAESPFSLFMPSLLAVRGARQSQPTPDRSASSNACAIFILLDTKRPRLGR